MEKIRTIAQQVYGADDIELSSEAQAKIDYYTQQVRQFPERNHNFSGVYSGLHCSEKDSPFFLPKKTSIFYESDEEMFLFALHRDLAVALCLQKFDSDLTLMVLISASDPTQADEINCVVSCFTGLRHSTYLHGQNPPVSLSHA